MHRRRRRQIRARRTKRAPPHRPRLAGPRRPVSAPPGAPHRQAGFTFDACNPFSVSWTSNSTAWPAAKLLNPGIWMALYWTKTSAPSACGMNPKPFSALNHFTVPVARPATPFDGGALVPWGKHGQNQFPPPRGRNGSKDTPREHQSPIWAPSLRRYARRVERSIPDKPSLDGLEPKWAAVWEHDGTFRYRPGRPRAEVFSIDTPPPTVSGSLHVGH